MTVYEPWLTVVTVVKDAHDAFARTVESLASQSERDFEFVVIDSSSDTATVSGIGSSLPHSYTWSPPQGIYAAMNIGLSKAAGRYIYFLNAGDVLDSPQTLDRVRRSLEDRAPTWAFGPVRITGTDNKVTVTPEWDYRDHQASLFARGSFPPHQGTFVQREILTAIGGFDLSYRVAADYAAFLKISQLADPQILDFVIANFTEGGTSTTQWLESFREFHTARRRTFRPTGLASVSEFALTVKQIVAVGLYRGIWSKLVRSRHGPGSLSSGSCT